MSCCGQKRQAWRNWNAANAPVAPAPPVLQNPIVVRYLGTSSLVVKGAATGRAYLFAGQDVGLTVDERDAPALISTGRFVTEMPGRADEAQSGPRG